MSIGMASQRQTDRQPCHAKLDLSVVLLVVGASVYMCGCVLYPVWSSTVVRREEKAVVHTSHYQTEHSAAQRSEAATLAAH